MLLCITANIWNFICRLIAPELTQTRGITKHIFGFCSFMAARSWIYIALSRSAGIWSKCVNSTSPGIHTAVPKHQRNGFWTQSGVCLQALGGDMCAKQAKMSTRSHGKKSLSLSLSLSSLSLARFPLYLCGTWLDGSQCDSLGLTVGCCLPTHYRMQMKGVYMLILVAAEMSGAGTRWN